MNRQTPVINISGDHEESILQFAKHLGKDKNRRAVFNFIYGRGTKPKSKAQIATSLGISGSTQVVQNALDELSKHHLITKQKNAGFIDDRSQFVYSKSESVRANRDKIVKYADNPAAAKRVPTKRRPMVGGPVSFVAAKASNGGLQRRRTKSKPSYRSARKLKIAFLITNPDTEAPLQTAIEARDVETAIRSAKYRDQIDLKLCPAPTFASLIDILNGFEPNILHFSGHGGGSTLLFDNENPANDGGTILDYDLIARLLESVASKPQLMVLAACETVDGATRFSPLVSAVVAMSDSIGDEAACAFSSRFYKSIADGTTIEQALNQAKLVLEQQGYKDATLPTLIVATESAKQRQFFKN